ncbi:hypothetical protein [Pantoea agglomerans]|uniref:hypothetical protein n=1 Tax=Enterobacter agglomerans TaxID=549 RepID=UPI003C7EB0BF
MKLLTIVLLAAGLSLHPAKADDIIVLTCTDSTTEHKTVVQFNDSVNTDNTLTRVAAWTDRFGPHYGIDLYFKGTIASDDDGKLHTTWLFSKDKDGETYGSGLMLDTTDKGRVISYTLSNSKAKSAKGNAVFSEGSCQVTDRGSD